MSLDNRDWSPLARSIHSHFDEDLLSKVASKTPPAASFTTLNLRGRGSSGPGRQVTADVSRAKKNSSQTDVSVLWGRVIAWSCGGPCCCMTLRRECEVLSLVMWLTPSTQGQEGVWGVVSGWGGGRSLCVNMCVLRGREKQTIACCVCCVRAVSFFHRSESNLKPLICTNDGLRLPQPSSSLLHTTIIALLIY